MTGEPGPEDQLIGTGNGSRTDFPLVKHYEGQERRITRPVAGTVRISVGGVERVSGWTLGRLGMVRLDAAPAQGVEVRAGYRFDVPVRFAEDRLSLSRATFEAGEAASVPLIEIREMPHEHRRGRSHHHRLLLAGGTAGRNMPRLHQP
jgi:uncharacterized protein (TIGR02217 family)